MSALDTVAARQASLDSVGTKPFANLRDQMSPEAREAAARRTALLEAAQIALDMFDASGKTPAQCACGQCIATAIKRKAEQ